MASVTTTKHDMRPGGRCYAVNNVPPKKSIACLKPADFVLDQSHMQRGGVGLLPISFGGDIAFVKAARGDGISRQRTDSAGVFFRAARRHGKYVP